MCVDEILVGVGRAPNVEGLGLEAAGVDFDTTAGVRVDDHLRTSNASIYAAGDVCSAYKFTHVADALAQIVIQNALFPHPFGLGSATTRSLLVPWCTYTTPEIAHVEMDAAACAERGTETVTYTYDLAEVDRATSMAKRRASRGCISRREWIAYLGRPWSLSMLARSSVRSRC
ncbi:hypothetical protein BH18PSE1_BH18PSE1_03870 [soil metagenome]